MRIIFIVLLIFSLSCGGLAAAENQETASSSGEDAEIIQDLELLQEWEMLENAGLLEDYETVKNMETQETEGEANEESN